MRVLVTGATGFLGSHVVEKLLDDNHDVVAVGSLRHNGESLRVVEAITATPDRGEFTWLLHDLAAPFSETQVRQLGEVDAIVNVASLSSVDASIIDPVGFTQNNVNVVLHTLELARRVRPSCFIHMSTDEVYGSDEPCDALHHRPSSPYAASKSAQEDICRAYALTFNVPVQLVRSANMFGERQSTLAFIPKIVRTLLRRDSVKIHVTDAGPGVRNYTYVKNVANFIATLPNLAGTRFRQHTLRGQATVDNLTLARTIARVAGLQLHYELTRASDVRPGYDVKYALHGDEWNPSIEFEVGLERTVRYLLNDLAP